MGVTAAYRRITAGEWDDLRRLAETKKPGFDLESAYLEFAYSEDLLASDRYFSLDKDWHALHALLTGDFDNPSKIRPYPPPLGNAIIGGTETPFDATYDKVRVLDPTEVRAVAEALGHLDIEVLRSRIDPVAFNAAPIYPNPRPGGWDSEEIESVLDYLPPLVDFFTEAARQGDLVLLSLD